MVAFNFTYDPNVTLEQRLGFEMAAAIWSQFLTDSVVVNLRIAAIDGLNGNESVGGAVPIFQETNYGVFQEYLRQDAKSAEDASVLKALQTGNTVDILVDIDKNPATAAELVTGNTTMMVTRAQAKALGMQKALRLANGGVWDRDVIQSPDALDGYIVVNNSYNWGYDLTRKTTTATNKSLDFLTMAVHEMGHTLGFISGLDGLLETLTLHSGQTRATGFTALDLMRYSKTSSTIKNPDGSVSELSFGGDAYFSLDGGQTSVADFENEYQASHWKRTQDALGIMDPTLGYNERTDIHASDLKAFDVLGWDVNYSAFSNGLDLNSLYAQAIAKLSAGFGVGVAEVEGAINNGQDWYSLGYGSWWQAFKEQMIDLGYGSWWATFEKDLSGLGYGSWWQSLQDQVSKLGYGSWWQVVKTTAINLGYGSWWTTFETAMTQRNTTLNLGYGSWWQQFEPKMLELSYGSWWQIFEKQMSALGYGSWWQQFETDLLGLGYGSWWQAFKSEVLQLGYGSWWQVFENKVLELGYGSWWQQFESSMTQLGYGSWWQTFDIRYGSWWLQIEDHLNELDTSSNIEANTVNGSNLNGGASDDILAGTTGNDLISGDAGDDLIDGKEGDDLILGDAGNDIIYGWDGNDVLFGGAGDDLLTGENGDDKLYGEDGADILAGGRGADILVGGAGRDVLKGDTEDDLLDGGSEDDKLSGGSGNDLLVGGTGQDVLDGGDGNDVLYGDQYTATTTTNTTNSLNYGAIAATPNFWVRLEAENMNLRNYSIDELTGTSGGKVVATRGRGSSNGRASTTFDGISGTYDLIVGYYDQAGSTATITLEVRGQNSSKTYTIQLAGNTGVGSYKIPGVTLAAGDQIEFRGSSAGDDLARLDYLDILTPGITPKFDANGKAIGQLNVIEATQGKGEVKRIEAESLQLASGYVIQTDSNASGNSVIVNTGSTTGTATYTHTGEAGIYNLYANYFDASAGNAQAEVFINGQRLTRWNFNLNDNVSRERTLGLNITLNQGDVIQIRGTTNLNEQAMIDYLVLESVAATESAKLTTSRIEVEKMTLSGVFKVEDNRSFASGLSIVKSDDKITGFTASTNVPGATGLYDIVIGYYDENDGIANYKATLAGNDIANWQSNLDLGKSGAEAQSFITRTIRGVLVNSGDTFNIQSIAKDGDNGYLDYVEFIPYNPSATIRVEAERMQATGDSEIKNYTFSSNGFTVRSKSTDAAKTVNLSTTFDGLAGIYNLVIGYYDENDGLAKFTTSLNGVQKASWVANQNLGFNDVSMQTFTTKTITGLQLKSGDVLNLSSLRESGDYGAVDYIEFVPQQSVVQSNALQIEVEKMDLAGKATIKSASFAYGGRYVETDNDVTGFTGTSLFQGATGYYKIVVGYYDDNEGAAAIALKVDNKEIDRWYADQNFGVNAAKFEGFTTHTVTEGVHISNMDLITLTAIEDGGDRANIDFIKFIAVNAPTVIPTQTPAVDPQAVNADILRGGVGNDTMYGGEGNDQLIGGSGNDLLYGDSATVSASSGNDILNGTDAIALGKQEIDILIGGGGADRFVLGDAQSAYYYQGGVTDYAVIRDFSSTLGDVIQLHGSAANYKTSLQGGDTLLFWQGQDLIAQFTGITSLALTSQAFQYVT